MEKENKKNYEERESQSMDIVEATPEEFDEVLQEMSGTSTTKVKHENEFSYIGDPIDEKNTYDTITISTTKNKKTENVGCFYSLKTPNYSNIITSNRIKRIRRKINLSEQHFAEMLGVTLETVLNWENGKCLPSGIAMRLLYLLDNHIEQSRELFDLIDNKKE